MDSKMLTLCASNNSKQAHSQKIDILLESIGLIRIIVPRDNNSLFRCISQCVFLTQTCHMIVRQHLIQFANLKTDEFNEMTQMPVDLYILKITDKKMDGKLLDMYIAAKLYKINISFYADSDPFMPLVIETPNSVKTLQICINVEGTYDLVFTKNSVVNISLCQSIVYKMLYNDVFRLSNVDFAVKEMLSGRFFPLRKNDQGSLEKRATCTDMRELHNLGITPFPFKVAKALNSNLYRNSEYDIWLNNKKEKFYGRLNNWEFKIGSKCLVSINNHEYECYIQHIRGKNEPVEVYVKELADKIRVDFSQLKLIPVDEDVRVMVENPIQIDQVSSSVNNDDCVFEVNEQFEPSVQYSNNFIQRPATQETLLPVIPGQIYSPTYYGQINQQQPMASLNSNIGNMMHPWYVSTLPPTIVDSSSNANRVYVQPILPPWCYHQPPNLSFNNINENGVTMNFNPSYQPWILPEFNEPANEVQQ